MVSRTSRRLGVGLAAAALAASGFVALQTVDASAAGTICEQYGTTTTGNYVIMNNRWGTTATQCISTSDSGFTITQQDGVGNTSGAPVSYPAIYIGCHYTKCSPNSPLPKQVSSITNAVTNLTYSYVSGATYDAAFDIWLDPSAKTNGVNQTEIMIWFNRQGQVQPIGSPVGNTTVGGKQWQVWSGNNGGNDVVSYLAPSAVQSWQFDVMDFVRDVISRGKAQQSWYLTSIQAGFEPWIGGTGLSVSNFSSTINQGGWTQQPTTTQPTTTQPTWTPPTTTTTWTPPTTTKTTKTKTTKTFRTVVTQKCKTNKKGVRTCRNVTKTIKG